LPIPIAPQNEQKSIVSEIEKQFSRLDEAVVALKRIKANLKHYKASVLKAAVEGKLTEEWRKEHPDIEPASELLKRILVERRRKWEEDHPKKKYKKPYSLNITDLPVLPNKWTWATFEQVSNRVTVGHVGPMKNEYVEKGIPFLRSQNVRENKYNPKGLKFISAAFHDKLQKSALKPGDIVVVRSGSVGVSCAIPVILPEANCSDLVIVKEPKAIIPEYGAYYMNSITNTRVASKRVGVALTHFNTKSMAAMSVPVPTIAEQQEIVYEVERRLSIIDEAEMEIDKNLKRAERLRQSILKKAFSGRLI
ncbi:MAG: restriction endonuclease subunit S, partial [Planctomycetota bacterium]